MAPGVFVDFQDFGDLADIFADFRDFGDLELGQRALDRSEAGRQAPREDFDRFPMDFH